VKASLPAVATAALLALAAPAHAGTTIGEVATSNPSNCPGNTEFMQNAVGTGGPSYDAPGPGVITSWSTVPTSATGTGARLKVYRPTSDAHDWTVVGESDPETLVPSTPNTFATRIPVQAGDRLAIRTVGAPGGPCLFPGGTNLGASYSVFFFQAVPDPSVDPGAGSGVTFADEGEHQLVDISAVEEPDADGDGFGDETQDRCPGLAGTFDGCPTPPSSPPPPPPRPTTPPKLRLNPQASAAALQHVLKLHGIVLTVEPNLASSVTATATVSVPAASTVLRFKRVKKTVAAGRKATLRLTLSKAQLRRVQKALAGHRKLTAKATVTTSASGSSRSVAHLKIALRR
jgi:hypothetical protein